MNFFGLSAAARSAIANALIARFDAGGGPATLSFYSDEQPADPDTAVTTQTLLGTLTCSFPSATETDGFITFDPLMRDEAADATGTATWARLATSDGVGVADFSVSDTYGDGAIKLNTTDIVEGGPISISRLSVVMPGAYRGEAGW